MSHLLHCLIIIGLSGIAGCKSANHKSHVSDSRGSRLRSPLCKELPKPEDIASVNTKNGSHEGLALSGEESDDGGRGQSAPANQRQGIDSIKQKATEQTILNLYNVYKGVEAEYQTTLNKADAAANARPFNQANFDAAILVAESKRSALKKSLQNVIDACEGREVAKNTAADYPDGFEFEYLCTQDVQLQSKWTFNRVVSRTEVPNMPLLCKSPNIESMQCDKVVDRLTSNISIGCDKNSWVMGQKPGSRAKAYTLRTLPPEVYSSGPSAAQIQETLKANETPERRQDIEPPGPFKSGTEAYEEGDHIGELCKTKVTNFSVSDRRTQCYKCCDELLKNGRAKSNYDDLATKACRMACYPK